jgi:hypothetical protein
LLLYSSYLSLGVPNWTVKNYQHRAASPLPPPSIDADCRAGAVHASTPVLLHARILDASSELHAGYIYGHTTGVIQRTDGYLLCQRLFVGAVDTELHLVKIPKWPSAQTKSRHRLTCADGHRRHKFGRRYRWSMAVGTVTAPAWLNTVPTAWPSAQPYAYCFFNIYTHLFISLKYSIVFIYCCQVFIQIVRWWSVSTC